MAEAMSPATSEPSSATEWSVDRPQSAETAPSERPVADTAPAMTATDTTPETAPVTSQQTAALPADTTTGSQQDNGIPRDWSLAAQAIFADSNVTVPEPSTVTPRDRVASNDAFHAEPAPEASRPSLAEGPMNGQGDPHGDLTIVPASTPETKPQTAAIPEAYPLAEGEFYTAQLASFRTLARANQAWEILTDSAGELLQDQNGFIVLAELGEELGTYYRIRAGTMQDRAAAQQFCEALQAKGLDCMPVKTSWQETQETLVDKICQSGSADVVCDTTERSGLDLKGVPHTKG